MIQPYPVLIVDDEADILTSFDLCLRAIGIDNVIRCQNPAEALRILDAQPLGAMVLDLSMPGVTGQEILTRVRETRPELPVIVATGVESIVDATRQPLRAPELARERQSLQGPTHRIQMLAVLHRIMERVRELHQHRREPRIVRQG